MAKSESRIKGKYGLLLVVAVIAIIIIFGWYFLTRPRSEVTLSISPWPVHISGEYTYTWNVANRESQTIIIQSMTVSEYINGYFYDKATDAWDASRYPGIKTDRVLPGETSTVYSDTFHQDNIGIIKLELTLHTNIGDLKTTNTYTVLP